VAIEDLPLAFLENFDMDKPFILKWSVAAMPSWALELFKAKILSLRQNLQSEGGRNRRNMDLA